MKTKTILLTVTSLFLLVVMAGCDGGNRNIDYYSGEIITLNNGDGCYDILKVKQSPENGFPAGTTISFYVGAENGKFKIGETIWFKVKYYEKWTGSASAMCLWPSYSASIELVSHIKKK